MLKSIPLTPVYLTAFMLVLCLAPMPYGYYTLIRLVATGMFLWAAAVSLKSNKQIIPWVFVLLALLFNPVLKVHFAKEVWAWIDIISALFLVSTYGHRSTPRNEST